MAMEITNSYSSYAVQSMAGSSALNSTKKKGTEKSPETEKTLETTGSSKSKSTAEYVNELAKLVLSVELKVGNTFSTAKSGITLTINPQLLEKMQNDPEKEKEMKELIKGVESAVNMLERVNNASGWTVVFKHCYIDENGEFRSIAYLRNDFMLNMSDELREERRQNSEKLLERQKEKAAEKKEESEERNHTQHMEEREAERAEEKSAHNKVKQLLDEKIAASKDGVIYLDDADLKTIIEDIKEDNANKTKIKEESQVGVNLDLKV